LLPFPRQVDVLPLYRLWLLPVNEFVSGKNPFIEQGKCHAAQVGKSGLEEERKISVGFDDWLA
jgi:hypothetical protein